MRLIAVMIFSILLLWDCNESNKQASTVSKDTADTVGKPKDTLTTTSNDDSDDLELTAIVNDLKSGYNKTLKVDTTFTRGLDSFRLLFNYKCLFDNGLLIPKKYVDIYGFESFTTHSFAANLILFKNSTKIVDDKITKSTFADQIDESLKKYATLSYPYITIEDSIIKVHFSVSIPLTDVGVATAYIARLNGQTYTRAD